MEEKKERKSDRRRVKRRDPENDKRKGKLKQVYQRLVASKALVERRKDDRRRQDRRTGKDQRGWEHALTMEERYAIYIIGATKENFTRKALELPPKPILNYEQWKSSQKSPKEET